MSIRNPLRGGDISTISLDNGKQMNENVYLHLPVDICLHTPPVPRTLSGLSLRDNPTVAQLVCDEDSSDGDGRSVVFINDMLTSSRTL